MKNNLGSMGFKYLRKQSTVTNISQNRRAWGATRNCREFGLNVVKILFGSI